jgi:hypothetical protein
VVWQKLQDIFPPKPQSSPPTMAQQVSHWASVVLTVHFVWFGFIILNTPQLRDIPQEFFKIFGF